MKNSTAKIAYMYASDSFRDGHSEAPLPATAFLFMPPDGEDIILNLEFGLVGLADNNFYTLTTRFFIDDEEVGYPNRVAEPNKMASFFAKSGEFAMHSSSTEHFPAKNNGYYKIESKLYETNLANVSEGERPPLAEEDIVHKIDIYVAVSSEWSE